MTRVKNGAPPNVVVFFTDQQRWDTVGAYGNPLGLTPNLDRLAGRGTLVKHCFTCQPVCGPARSSMQTGQYASQTGVHVNGLRLPADKVTLAHCFNNAGYETAYFGKWHLAGRDNPDGPVPEERRGGYRHWLAADRLELVTDAYDCRLYNESEEEVSLPGYRVDAVTDAAIRWIDTHSNEPFFCFVSHLEPHQQNSRDDYPAPYAYRGLYENQWMPGDLKALGGNAAEQIDGYLGMVRRLDDALGRLIDLLESREILDNTVILFTSDHGCHFKTRNDEYKRSCHDASIRIPCVLAGPGLEAGQMREDLISLLDMPPTLLDLAGIDIPDSMQGESILCKPASDSADEAVLIQISEQICGRAIRTQRWTYCIAAPDSVGVKEPWSHVYHETHLYDLQNDPHELNNLVESSDHSIIRSELKQILLGKIQHSGDPLPKIVQSEKIRAK